MYTIHQNYVQIQHSTATVLMSYKPSLSRAIFPSTDSPMKPTVWTERLRCVWSPEVKPSNTEFTKVLLLLQTSFGWNLATPPKNFVKPCNKSLSTFIIHKFSKNKFACLFGLFWSVNSRIIFRAPPYGRCPMWITVYVRLSVLSMGHNNSSFVGSIFINFIHNTGIRRRKTPFNFFSIYRFFGFVYTELWDLEYYNINN